MISEESKAVVEKARRIYESQLREELEANYSGRYVSIEPVSGSYFLGETFDDAVNAAIDAFPERLTHTLRIGHSVDLETFTCYLNWFGEVYRTQVVANDGEFALLGTMLMADRKLAIDY